MKQNSIFFYFMLVILAVTVASSCDKDEETKEYISGTITFYLPGYCYIGDSFVLKSEADIIEPTEGVGYYWRSNDEEILKDTIAGHDYTMNIPDSIGSYSITAYASAEGYNSNSNTKTIVAIDTTFGVSVAGLSKGNDSIVDPRDKIKYYIAKIGKLDWFIQNLRYAGVKGGPSVGAAYQNEEVLSDVFGRLYTWEEATAGMNSTGLANGVTGICPDGWSIPTKEDWVDFGKALNGDVDIEETIEKSYDDMWYGLAGKAMVEALLNGEKMWPYNYKVEKSNEFHWNGIPAGNSLYRDNRFENLLLYGMWWSGTQSSLTKATYRYIYYNNSFFAPSEVGKTDFSASVRCVRLAI